MLLVVAISALAAASPRLVALPTLSRRLEKSAPQPAHADTFSVVAALDSNAATTLNQLFGTCFPLHGGDDGELHADLCTPMADGAPTLLLLASDSAPLSALAVSDVWVATLPPDATAVDVDTLLTHAANALAQLPSAASDAPPRQLLIVTSSDALTADSRVQQRWHELCLARATADGGVEIAGRMQVQAHSLATSGPELLARFTQPHRDDALLPAGGSGVCAAVGVAIHQVSTLIEELHSLLGARSEGARSEGAGSEGAGSEGAAMPAGTPPSRMAVDEWPALLGCGTAAPRPAHRRRTG